MIDDFRGPNWRSLFVCSRTVHEYRIGKEALVLQNKCPHGIFKMRLYPPSEERFFVKYFRKN